MLAIAEKTPDKIKAVTGFKPIPPPKHRRNHRPTDRAMKLLVGNDTHLRRFLSTVEKSDYDFFFLFCNYYTFLNSKKLY